MKTLLGGKTWFSPGVGVLPPEQLVQAAREAGYEHLVLCEEGELAGEHALLRSAQKLGIRITPGVELYTAYQDLPPRRIAYYPLNDRGLETIHRLTAAAGWSNELPVIQLDSTDLTDVAVGTSGAAGYVYDFWLTGRGAAIPDFLGYLKDRGGPVALELDVTPRLLPAAAGLRRLARAWPAIPRYPQAFLRRSDVARRAAAEIAAYHRLATTAEEATGLFEPLEHLARRAEGLFDPAETERWVGRLRGIDPERWTGASRGTLALRPGETLAEAQAKLQAYCGRRLEEKIGSGSLGGREPGVYRERLEEELRLAEQLEAAPYFLTVAGYCRRCHEAGICVRARGSGCASLLLLLCDVTTEDPVARSLPIIRFLNPSRSGLPDIDLDIQADKIAQARRLAGEHLGRALRLRQVLSWSVRDALQHTLMCLGDPRPEEKLKAIKTKLGGEEWPRSWPEFTRTAVFRDLQRDDRRIVSIARHLCGMPRGFALHAAGVGAGALTEDGRLPMAFTPAGKEAPVLTPALPYQDAIQAGLLKYDLLAAPYLTFLVKLHARLFPEDPQPHWRIRAGLDPRPESERLVRAVLERGLTTGIFQLGSRAARDLCQELRPGTPEEISQASALLRLTADGGPQIVRRFLSGTPVPAILQPLVGATRGMFLFQEQLMEAGTRLGGFTPEESDCFRVAVTKQRPELLRPLREQLRRSLLEKHGVRAPEAERIAGQIAGSRYTFNKAHSDSYAQLIGRAAFYKAVGPEEFAAEYLAHLRAPPGASDPFPSEEAKRQEAARCIFEIRCLGGRVGFGRWTQGTATTVIRHGHGPVLSLGVDVLFALKRDDLQRLDRLKSAPIRSGVEALSCAGKLGLAGDQLLSLIVCGWFDDEKGTTRLELAERLPGAAGQTAQELLRPGLAAAEVHILGFATDRTHPGLPRQDGALLPYEVRQVRGTTRIVGYLHRPVQPDDRAKVLSLGISTLLGDPPLEVDFSLPQDQTKPAALPFPLEQEVPLAVEVAPRSPRNPSGGFQVLNLIRLDRAPGWRQTIGAFAEGQRRALDRPFRPAGDISLAGPGGPRRQE